MLVTLDATAPLPATADVWVISVTGERTFSPRRGGTLVADVVGVFDTAEDDFSKSAFAEVNVIKGGSGRFEIAPERKGCTAAETDVPTGAGLEPRDGHPAGAAAVGERRLGERLFEPGWPVPLAVGSSRPAMLSLERPPTSALAPFVQLLWCLELDAPGAFGGDERIVPDGIVELVLHYREPMRVRHAGGGFTPQPRASLVSQTRRFVEIRPGGATGLVSVRFRPWGAHRFLRQPLSELSDRVVDARDLWGRSDVAELEERLAAAPDTECRLALVEGFLLRHLGEAAAAHLEGLVRAFWASGGRTPIAHLARDLGWSERGLQRVFAAAVGASPKGYARLCRFLGACTRLRRGDWASLTELGHACGYYDQSHFTSDFKGLAGLTPGEFLSAERLSFLELA